MDRFRLKVGQALPLHHGEIVHSKRIFYYSRNRNITIYCKCTKTNYLRTRSNNFVKHNQNRFELRILEIIRHFVANSREAKLSNPFSHRSSTQNLPRTAKLRLKRWRRKKKFFFLLLFLGLCSDPERREQSCSDFFRSPLHTPSHLPVLVICFYGRTESERQLS